MGTTWGKIPGGETVKCSGCVSWSKVHVQGCMTVGRSLCPIDCFPLRGHLLCLEDGHLITLKHGLSIFSMGTNSVFWQRLKATARTAYLIFRAEHEMKMQAPCSQIMKNFKMVTAGHYTKPRFLLSVDLALLQRLLAQRRALPAESPASATGCHLGLLLRWGKALVHSTDGCCITLKHLLCAGPAQK